MAPKLSKSSAGPDHCRTCRRSFLTTRNPVIKDASSSNLLKRRAPMAGQCKPCFTFLQKDPDFSELSSDERYEKIYSSENEKKSFMARLLAWEADRREGRHRSHKATAKVHAVAETTAGVETKEFLGYLWPVSLLKSHDRPVPRRLQSITHLGKKVRGAVLSEFVIGAIELSTRSTRTARQVTALANEDSDDEQAQEAYAGMEKSFNISCTVGEDGVNIKNRKVAADSDDEMTSILWGGCSIGAGGASASGKQKGKTSDSEDDVEDKRPSRNKRHRAGNPASAPTLTSSGIGNGGDEGQNQLLGWTLPGLPNQGDKQSKKKCNESRELERSEAIVLQSQQFRASLSDPQEVMKLSLSRATALLEKVEGRLTEDLVGIYMEIVRASGPGSRAAIVWDSLKSAKSALGFASEFLEALHDAEAAPATLSSRARTLESETDVKLPQCVTSVMCRRSVEEMAQNRDFASVFKFLNPSYKHDYPAGVGSLMPPSEDGKPDNIPDEIREFQCNCLAACLNHLFMTSCAPTSNDEAEAKKQKEANMQKIIQDIHRYCREWLTSDLCKGLTEAKCGIVDDIAKLQVLVGASLQSSVVDQATVENVEQAKQALAKNKTGVFYAAVSMCPIGIEICGRASKLTQQFRKDAILAMDIEIAANIAEGLKAFTGEALLKPKDGELEVSIPSQHKVFDMTAKWLAFEETASDAQKKASEAHVVAVTQKVQELHEALRRVVMQKYESFDFFSVATELAKGSALDDGPPVHQMLCQLAAFSPMAKVSLTKLLGKDIAKKLEDDIQSVTKVINKMRDAYPLIVKVMDGHVDEELLAQPLLVEAFDMLNDHGLRYQLQVFASNLDRGLGLLQDCIHSCLLKWLQQTSTTFVSFAAMLLQPECRAQEALREDILGDISGIMDKDEKEDGQDAKQQHAGLDWGLAFHTYFRRFSSASIVKVEIKAGDETTPKPVHASFVCIAGSLLKVAKYVMVFKHKIAQGTDGFVFLEMLDKMWLHSRSGSKEPLVWETCTSKIIPCQVIVGKFIQATKAFDEMYQVACQGADASWPHVEGFYSGLKDIFVAAVGDCIQKLSEDFDSISKCMRSLYDKVAEEHSIIDVFQSEGGDKAAMLKLCADASLQQLAFGCAKADRSLAEMASFMGEVKTLQVGAPTWISDQSSTNLGVLSNDLVQFRAVGKPMEEDKASDKCTMATIRYVYASMTLGQALCRDLQPGETRLGLIIKCLGLLDKKGLAAEPILKKRAASIKGSGKGGSK